MSSTLLYFRLLSVFSPQFPPLLPPSLSSYLSHPLFFFLGILSALIFYYPTVLYCCFVDPDSTPRHHVSDSIESKEEKTHSRFLYFLVLGLVIKFSPDLTIQTSPTMIPKKRSRSVRWLAIFEVKNESAVSTVRKISEIADMKRHLDPDPKTLTASKHFN